MSSRFAAGAVGLGLAILSLSFPATAQPPLSSSVKVLVVGAKATSIIDDGDYTLLATVPHPPGNLCGWWHAADGSRAILVFQGKSSQLIIKEREDAGCNKNARLQVLDLVEHRELADLPLDSELELAAATPDGKTVVIAFEGKKDSASLVAVDATAGAIAGRLVLPEFPDNLVAAGSTRLMAVVLGSPDQTNSTPGRIDLFALPSLEARGSIALPGPVTAVFWNRERTLLYALDQGIASKKPQQVRPRRVYVVDPAGGTVVADLDLGPPSAFWEDDAIGVVPTPDYSRYLVLHEQNIELLDGKLTAVLGTIALGHEEPRVIAFLGSTRAYVGYEGSGKVSVLDLAEPQVLTVLATGGAGIKFGKIMLLAGGIIGQAVLAGIGGPSVQHETSTSAFPAPDGKTMLISNSQTEAVTVIDARTNEAIEEFDGIFAQVLADGRTVAAAEATQLNRYDTVEHKLLPPLPLTTGGRICPDGRHVWTGGSPHLLRIDLEQGTKEQPLKGVAGAVLFVVSPPAQESPAPEVAPTEPKPEADPGGAETSAPYLVNR